jgi:putative ABC transport system permease protein
MDFIWILVARIRALVLRSRIDRDLEEELQAHIEMLAMEYRRSGMEPEEAQRAARLRLGGMDQTRDAVRDERRIPWIENFIRDTGEALRKWRRKPAMVIVTVLTLAIGVGTNIAMMDLVYALMFRPPDGIPSPDRVVSMSNAHNYVRYSEIRDQVNSLESAAYYRTNVSLGVGDSAAPICVECVTPSFFPVLGARPVLGRTFGSDENEEKREPGVLLSFGMWQRMFGSGAEVLGQPVTIGGRTFSVIGVAPRGFRGVGYEAVDAWILLPVSPDLCSFTGKSLLGAGGTSHWLKVIGRLGEGVGLSQAAAEIEAKESPESQFNRALSRDKFPTLEPILDYRRDRRTERLALWLAGGTLIMLVIACANVAGLSSIRALDRRRETAVRLQLGASRSRILAQHAAEHVLLAFLAGAAAALTAGCLAAALRAFFSYASAISLFDWRLFAAAFGLTLLAGILSGMIPAIQASRPDAAGLSNSFRSAYDRKGFRKALLVLQVALALVLVTGAGLFVRSVRNTRAGLGVDLDHLVIAAADMWKAGYDNPQEIRTIFDRMADRVRRLPGVGNVSLSSGSLFGSPSGAILLVFMRSVNGRSAGSYSTPAGTMEGAMPQTAVTPEYFSTAGSRIVSGRAFTDDDRSGNERVMIIDESMAGRMWPGEQAVGKYVEEGLDSKVVFRVVGVSESRRTAASFPNTTGEVFVPFAQAGTTAVPGMILIRTKGSAADAVPLISAAVRDAVPNLPYISVQPAEDLVDVQTRSWRVGQKIFSVFGAVSLLLACLGLYAVLAYSVRRRISEIGVRMALGATAWDILQLVFRQGLLIVAAGWLLGIGASLFLAGQIEKLLFQVKPVDPISFIFASFFVLAAGIAGCFLPSIRAARVDPAVTLRHE